MSMRKMVANAGQIDLTLSDDENDTTPAIDPAPAITAPGAPAIAAPGAPATHITTVDIMPTPHVPPTASH